MAPQFRISFTQEVALITGKRVPAMVQLYVSVEVHGSCCGEITLITGKCTEFFVLSFRMKLQVPKTKNR